MIATQLVIGDTTGQVKHGQASSSAGDGAATVYASLRPDEGEIYIVHLAVMLHDDDAAGRVMAWYWYDGSTRVAFWSSVATVTNGTYVSLYGSGNIIGGNANTGLGAGGALVCTRNSYLQAGCVAPAAPHKAYLNYVVRKIRLTEVEGS